MNQKFSRNIPRIIVALALAIIIGLGSSMIVSLQTLIENYKELHQTLLTQSKLQELLAQLIDTETGPRGYVIMGDEKFLIPYYDAISPRGGVIQHLHELRQMTASDPQLRSSFDKLEPLITAKLAFMKKVVALRRTAGFEATQKFIATDIGRHTMEDIRHILAFMIRDQGAYLLERSVASSLSMQKTFPIIATGTGLSIFMLLLSFIMVSREVIKRRESEDALQQLNSELDQRVKERTESLEVSAENLKTELQIRKQNESNIVHLSRMYATLSQVNQTIVRIKNQDDLFQTICRVSVEYGKFGLAWIGLIDLQTGLVTPAVVYGKEQSYISLRKINIKETPFKNGIIGSSVETEKICHSKNIQTDPAMQHWREMAIAGGFLSAASVPIQKSGTIMAVLNLYATEADFFDERQINLLKEMERDISFALDTLEGDFHRKRAEQALKHSEERFRTMFEGHSAIMMIINPDTGYIMEANRAATKFYGWRIDEFRNKRIQEINTLTPEQIHVAMKQSQSGEKTHVLFRHRRADNSIRDVEVYSCTIEISGEALLYTVVHNVTERVRHETASSFRFSLLEKTETQSVQQLLQTTLDKTEQMTESSIGFFHFVEGDQTTLSQQAWSTNTVKHRCKIESVGKRYGLDEAGVWADALRERKAVIHNDYASLKGRKGMPEGHAEISREVVVPIFRNDKVVALIGVGNKSAEYNEDDIQWITILADTVWDVLAKKIAEEERLILQAQKISIEQLAMHDSLTGLPNRRLLSERISLSLAQGRRNKTLAALMIFDLDRFKPVNDTLGHAIGDALLQQVAARSQATLQRSSDSIARIGGDEFVILLPQIAAPSNAVAIAEKILRIINEPFDVEGHAINISCSFGIAIFPDHGLDELTLMRHADEAMYTSKNEGRNRITVFRGER